MNVNGVCISLNTNFPMQTCAHLLWRHTQAPYSNQQWATQSHSLGLIAVFLYVWVNAVPFFTFNRASCLLHTIKIWFSDIRCRGI